MILREDMFSYVINKQWAIYMLILINFKSYCYIF